MPDTTPLCSTVHVVERMSPGGIETLVLDLLSGGAGDQRVFSLAGTTTSLVGAWPALGSHATALEAFAKPDGLVPALVMQLTRRFRALRPDAVVLHHIGPLVYGGLAARLARVRNIVHVEHDAWHYTRNPSHGKFMAVFERLVSPKHVAVSSKVAEAIRAIAPRAKITVIPPGIDTSRFCLRDRAEARKLLGLGTDHHIVGTVGRLTEIKNQRALIAALAHLPASVSAVIAGDGPDLPDLRDQASALGIADRITFLGQRQDVEQILPAFDVFCLPSENEGLPRSVLEAQACGIPVVAADVGALGEAVCRETGRLVPNCEPAALSKAIGALLAGPPSPLITRQHILDHYSLARTVASFQEVICAP